MVILSPVAEVWRDRPWGQKLPGRSRELKAVSEPADTQSLDAHSAELCDWKIPHGILQRGKGYSGQSLLWGTFTVICTFFFII